MAIITCPECGRDVSDHAKHCPHCGNTISRGSVFYTSIVVGTVIALLGIFTGLYIAHDRLPQTGDDIMATDSITAPIEAANLGPDIQQSDSLDWLAAQEENTFESYLAYLQQHPNGIHSLEARDLIEQLAVLIATDTLVAADSLPQPLDTLQQNPTPVDTLSVHPSDSTANN